MFPREQLYNIWIHPVSESSSPTCKRVRHLRSLQRYCLGVPAAYYLLTDIQPFGIGHLIQLNTRRGVGIASVCPEVYIMERVVPLGRRGAIDAISLHCSAQLHVD